MTTTRKYWIGVSDEFDTKPTDFEVHVVYSEEDMLDAQHDIAVWIATDYLEEGEHDTDDEPALD